MAEVVGDVGAAEEDDAVRGEAVVALPGRRLEQPGSNDGVPPSSIRSGFRPPVDLVEARFGASEAQDQVCEPGVRLQSDTRSQHDRVEHEHGRQVLGLRVLERCRAVGA